STTAATSRRCRTGASSRSRSGRQSRGLPGRPLSEPGTSREGNVGDAEAHRASAHLNDMAVPEHFARIAGRVDLDRLMEARVVVIGLGTVGSPIVAELAACGVRKFRLVDGDTLEPANLPRHTLNADYLDMNKAEAM